MARKSKKKAETPEHPGRLLKHWYGEDHAVMEDITYPLGEKELLETAMSVQVIEDVIAEKSKVLAEAKAAVAGFKKNRDELIRRLVTRQFSEPLEVLRYADDATGIVTLYDAGTHEKVGERPLGPHERQEEMELDEDGDAEAEGNGDAE